MSDINIIEKRQNKQRIMNLYTYQFNITLHLQSNQLESMLNRQLKSH